MTGIRINGTIISDHPEGESYLMYLKSLRIEDGTIFIETRDNAKVVIDGQAVPRKCCANCKHYEDVQYECYGECKYSGGWQLDPCQDGCDNWEGA